MPSTLPATIGASTPKHLNDNALPIMTFAIQASDVPLHLAETLSFRFH